MPDLSPVQVLGILIERIEKRATVLEGVRLEAFDFTILELRNFARMLHNAKTYLQEQQISKR